MHHTHEFPNILFLIKLKVPSSISTQNLKKKKNYKGLITKGKTSCALTQSLTPKIKLLLRHGKMQSFCTFWFDHDDFSSDYATLNNDMPCSFPQSMRNLSLLVIQVIFPK